MKVSELYNDIWDIESVGIFQKLYIMGNLFPYRRIMDACGIGDGTFADEYYFNQHSPNKQVSDRFLKVIENNYDFVPEDGTMSDDVLDYIKVIFDSKFREKYKKYLEIINAEYNPIENYDRYEDLYRTYNDTGENTRDDVTDFTGTQTTKDQVEGFNSATFSDSDNSIRTDNLKTTLDGEGSFSNSGDETHTNHIHGNIGVTTAPTMLTEHSEFWDRFNVLDIMCHDIDTIITKLYY